MFHFLDICRDLKRAFIFYFFYFLFIKKFFSLLFYFSATVLVLHIDMNPRLENMSSKHESIFETEFAPGTDYSLIKGPKYGDHQALSIL